MRRASAIIPCLAAILAVSIAGCGDTPSLSKNEKPTEADPPVPTAEAVPEETLLTVSELHRKLKEKNPGYANNGEIRKAGGEIRHAVLAYAEVRDITPLAGLPLRTLDLTGSPVSDLHALEGMPLHELYLEGTQVSDVSPLAKLPLKILWLKNTPVADVSPLGDLKLDQLNLMGTRVTSIAAVRAMPLNTLWLPQTPVSDLSPLAEKRLESLDVQETPVEDLSPLRGMTSLRRLNIAGAKVRDLSPLAGLRLERLIFTPSSIEQGLDAIRRMESLTAIGTSFDDVLPPEQFWEQRDQSPQGER